MRKPKRDKKGRFAKEHPVTTKFLILMVSGFLLGIALQYDQGRERPTLSPVAEAVEIEYELKIETPIKTYPEGVDEEIERYIWDKWLFHGKQEAFKALAISYHENRQRDPDALNQGSLDVGIWQINQVHWDRFGGLGELVNPYRNTDAAYELYLEQGWNPWVVYNTGAYRSTYIELLEVNIELCN